MAHRSVPALAPLVCLAALFFDPSGALGQQAQPATAASAAQTPASPAPVPNRVNDVLPSWLRLRGEFRERMEAFGGAGFVDGRDDLYWLSRLRLNATVVASPSLSFQAQLQDARVAKKAVAPTGAPFSAPVDVRTAFVDVGSPDRAVIVRLGRQELAYGDQRLVGHVGWLNAARTFDAAKVTVRGNGMHVEAFGASVVRVLDGLDKSGNGNRFAGVYAAIGPLEPYVFWRRDVTLRDEAGGIGDLKQTTVGARLTGKLRLRLDYGVEVALQRGSLGADRVSAWAGHWQLRESLPGPAAARLTAEYNYASGDADPADGVRGTFDQLYPTPHDKYGLADQIGWKNVRHARAGIELTPIARTPVTLNYHSWWLAEARDGLYAAGSAPLARVSAGAAAMHVGQEIDVQLSRMVTPQVQVAGGYAHIFAGPFLQEATPGASYSHPYVMVTYVLLAER